MDAYEQLRQRARSKRDAAIRAAQSEFRQSVRRINELERKIGEGASPPPPGNAAKGRIVWTIIRSLIPQDREFTIDDMKRWLAENHSTRKFPASTVRASFRRLADQGLIRPVRRGHAAQVTWIACEDGSADDVPFASLSLPDAAEVVLRDFGPLREVELVLAIQQRGNRRDAPSGRVVKSLAKALQSNPGRFVCGDDGRWRLP